MRRNDKIPKLIATAEAWLGFTPTGGRTPFGAKTGYDGATWDGSFIDSIFHEQGIHIPSCAYSSSGLAEFIKQGRFHLKPQPGDIAFFVYSTGDKFGSAHVGLVADTSRYLTDGLVGTIEGQTSSGLAKSDPSLLGVFRRARSRHEILGYGRPNYNRKNEGQPGEGYKNPTGQRAQISLSSIQPGRRNKSIGLVQLALTKTIGSLGRITPDLFDGSTQQAYARWQRMNGYVGNDANGIPDSSSLQLLGDSTKIFELDAPSGS